MLFYRYSIVKNPSTQLIVYTFKRETCGKHFNMRVGAYTTIEQIGLINNVEKVSS